MPVDKLNYFQINLYISGFQNVYMKIRDGGYSNESSQLTAGSHTDLLEGILCENGEKTE